MANKLYNVAELADILSISPNTIRRWIMQKRIPFVKMGNRVRFRDEDVETIMKGVK